MRHTFLKANFVANFELAICSRKLVDPTLNKRQVVQTLEATIRLEAFQAIRSEIMEVECKWNCYFLSKF